MLSEGFPVLPYMTKSHQVCRPLYQLMPTSSIQSILVYPQSGYLLVFYMGLSLVPWSYLSVVSLQPEAEGSTLYR